MYRPLFWDSFDLITQSGEEPKVRLFATVRDRRSKLVILPPLGAKTGFQFVPVPTICWYMGPSSGILLPVSRKVAKSPKYLTHSGLARN